MRILIFGAGAIGCYYGAAMALSGCHTVLYLRDKKRAEIISRRGLDLHWLNDDPDQQVKVEVCTDLTDCGKVDLAFLAVKAYATDEAAAQLAEIAGDFPIISLQNGLGNKEKLCRKLDPSRLLMSVVYVGARMTAANTVVCAGPGSTIITPAADCPKEIAHNAAALLIKAGISCEIAAKEDFQVLAWEKLLVNSVLNPLSAIFERTNGELRADKDIWRQALALAEESRQVAAAKGINISRERMEHLLEKVCRCSAGNRTSMLEDISRGRPTEIEEINGAIVRIGEEMGMRVPLNRKMVEQIRKNSH